MDFRDHLSLRMMLIKHLVSLDIRMRYGIQIDNPLLTGIRQKYLLAYSVAVQGGGALKKYYGREIPEEEVPLANPDVPKTGDISGIWYTMTFLAAAGLVFITILARKNQEEAQEN